MPALPPVLVFYLLCINLLSFSAMGLDKRRSKTKDARRIPERRLFLFAIMGGTFGSVLGMQLFRHKTRHWYFVWGMPLLLFFQTTALLLYYIKK